MPIYEYTCKACNTNFEKLVKSMHENGNVKCPGCGSTKTARELSVFAVSRDAGKTESAPPMCGRCGGPGPCASGME